MSALLLAVATTACVRVRVHDSVPASGVPVALEGRWQGGWTSTATHPAATGMPANGALTLDLRTWQEHPLIEMVIDNPCIVGAAYELVFRGDRVELRRDGVAVFQGVLAADRTIAGDYACTEDAGTWTAAWTQDLPPVGDVTGTWSGGVLGLAASVPLQFALELEQVWTDGVLTLQGNVDVPAFGLQAPITAGLVFWNETGFRIELEAAIAGGPTIDMAGAGPASALRVDSGLLAVTLGPRLPSQTGAWQASWQGR